MVLLTLAGAVLAFTYVAKENVNSNGSTNKEAHQGELSGDIQKIANSPSEGIRFEDKIKNIDTVKDVPSGWKKYENGEYGLSFVHSPKLTVQFREPSRDSSGGDPTEHSFLFYDQSGKQSDCCTLNVIDKSLVEVALDIEDGDTGDDGKVVASPKRIWRDVKEKDSFTIDGHQGVRYVSTIRRSYQEDYQTLASYLISFRGKTYMYSTNSNSVASDNEAFRVLQSLVLK